MTELTQQEFEVCQHLDPVKLADLLTDYCLDVQAGQQISVRTSTLAAPLVVELQRAILQREAWPLFHLDVPGQLAGSYKHAKKPHLDGFAPIQLLEAQQLDASLSIQAPEDTRALESVDPDVITRMARGRLPVREALLSKRWATTVWPTASLAARSGKTLAEFSQLVSKAMFLDVQDPAAAWTSLRQFQDRLISAVDGSKEIRIQADGTDLRLRVDGRKWANSDGKRNMPSGEIFTSPIEESATGTIRFTLPSSPSGVQVNDVQLTFHRGEVIHAAAAEGEQYLLSALATDPGAKRLGEIGIGTNFGITEPTGVILLDEKIGGTVHLALGSSYPETGGLNQSALHWDLICDLRRGGLLTVDGKTVMQDGKFVGI